MSKSRRDFKRGQTVGARPRTELDELVRQEAESKHKTSKESLKAISSEKRSKLMEDKKAASAPTKDSKDVCGRDQLSSNSHRSLLTFQLVPLQFAGHKSNDPSPQMNWGPQGSKENGNRTLLP